MSRINYPLYVKSIVRVQPPLQWKGGLLAALLKGKGSPTLRDNYRDILLPDDSGKVAARLVRERLLPSASSLSVSTQFGGGVNGGETAFAHLYLRLVVDAGSSSRTSCFILFFDVVATIAQMLRRIVFNFDEGDEAWLASRRAVGFPEEDIKEACDASCSSDLVRDLIECENSNSNASNIPLDFRYAEQLYSNSWVSLE